MEKRTAFIITADTEADDEWAGSPRRTHRNISELPRFQRLCEEFGAKPTYLVTHDVCQDGAGRDVIADLAQNGRCEIGTHLHAWTTPPIVAEIEGDPAARPYLSEHTPEIQREKLAALTEMLTRVTGSRPTSYRGGRWDVDLTCLDLLAEQEYRVDTSVTPLVSWERTRGVTSGGPVYSSAPTGPYHPSPEDICAIGDHVMLEIPVSVGTLGSMKDQSFGQLSARFEDNRLVWAALKRLLRWTGLARRVWLDPVSESSADMRALSSHLVADGVQTLNVALHSSELVAGCAPHVADAEAEAGVWRRMRKLLQFAADHPDVEFMTLNEVADRIEQHAYSGVAVAKG